MCPTSDNTWVPNMATLNIIKACHDPHLFAPWFREATTWGPWFTALKALFGLPMDAAELALFAQCTGRTIAPTTSATEGWFIVGRRGGKSFITALIGVYLATFRDYSRFLAPGERATVMIVACDRRQARVIMRYVKALLSEVPMLRQMIVSDTTETIDLSNRVTIEIHAATVRSVRGYTLAAVLADEVAFWRSDESANPDREIINAVRPGMATIPGAMLIGISSPYSRRGVLWEAFRDHHGENGAVLVWRAPTLTMNPSVPQRIIDRAYAEDPLSAAAEYGAEFRSDVAGFLQSEWLDAAIMSGRHELPRQANTTYHGFADPSGGGADAFTLAIAHDEDGVAVLDVLRARRGSPEAAVQEFAAVLKAYGLSTVTGDRYAARWVVDAFARAGITYQHSELSKSDVYLEALPLFATGTVRLLDHTRLLVELRQLERRTSSSGKDTVDHPPRAHDDMANACCGALWLASARRDVGSLVYFIDVGDDPPSSIELSKGARLWTP